MTGPASNGDHRSIPKRLVLKLGSRMLTGGSTTLDPERMRIFVDAVAQHRGTETIIVSSGAIAAGYGTLGLRSPPTRIAERQAAAAIGQSRLMRHYSELFAANGIDVAQILLTNDCLLDRRRYVNARRAFAALFMAGVVPVVNENDTVSIDELTVGDNDNLAAHTAALADADLLVLLTDVPGVLNGDPRTNSDAQLVNRASSAGDLRGYCFGKRAPESVGGMATKLQAAEKAASYGIPTVIANGLDDVALRALYAGEAAGTRIDASAVPLPARVHWMSVQSKLTGGLAVDDGALAALRDGHSLLPRGIAQVFGRFGPGDLVAIVDSSGMERGRGVTRFDARDVDRIKGRHSSEVEQLLGPGKGIVVIHADKLVVLESR